MASSSSEITLDLMLAAGFTSAAVRRMVEDGSAGDGPARRRRMEECVRRLEEERRKIAVFRRELPLCMLLVSDAIDALKMEMEEEGGGGEEEKMSWLVSAQLWSDGDRSSRRKSKLAAAAAATEINKQMAGNGTLTPLKVCSSFPVVERKVPVPVTVPDLSLRAPLESESGSEESGSSTRSETGTNNNNEQYRSTFSTANLVAPPATLARKPRRSWSPDLHRRFVTALEQLGGPHVATPKQIREVMQVEGLTSDEVKSHLQKYRLHAKRASTTSQTPINQSFYLEELGLLVNLSGSQSLVLPSQHHLKVHSKLPQLAEQSPTLLDIVGRKKMGNQRAITGSGILADMEKMEQSRNGDFCKK